jgi:hypothetical protein
LALAAKGCVEGRPVVDADELLDGLRPGDEGDLADYGLDPPVGGGYHEGVPAAVARSPQADSISVDLGP